MKLTPVARYVIVACALSWGGFLLIGSIFGAWFGVLYIAAFYLVYLVRLELHQFIERATNGKANKNDEDRRAG